MAPPSPAPIFVPTEIPSESSSGVVEGVVEGVGVDTEGDDVKVVEDAV